MQSRLTLQEKLVEVLGSTNVYFQPPEDVRLKYPCIVYERNDVDAREADDYKYVRFMRYSVTYISRDPETNAFIEKMLETFKYSDYDRHFVTDNLNHEIFTIYF